MFSDHSNFKTSRVTHQRHSEVYSKKIYFLI
jgi:hypothetical protein